MVIENSLKIKMVGLDDIDDVNEIEIIYIFKKWIFKLGWMVTNKITRFS